MRNAALLSALSVILSIAAYFDMKYSANSLIFSISFASTRVTAKLLNSYVILWKLTCYFNTFSKIALLDYLNTRSIEVYYPWPPWLRITKDRLSTQIYGTHTKIYDKTRVHIGSACCVPFARGVRVSIKRSFQSFICSRPSTRDCGKRIGFRTWPLSICGNINCSGSAILCFNYKYL